MADVLSLPHQVDQPAVNGDGRAAPSRRPVLPRRRPLPGRRAVAGGVLVALAALGLFTSFARAGAAGRQQVVVASHALPAGTRLRAADLSVVAVRLPAAQRAHGFVSVDSLVGRLVVGPVGEGGLIQAASVTQHDDQPPFRQLTVLVDASQLQAVDEGDTVDVLVTIGTGAEARTEVAAGGAQVLRLSRRSGGV